MDESTIKCLCPRRSLSLTFEQPLNCHTVEVGRGFGRKPIHATPGWTLVYPCESEQLRDRLRDVPKHSIDGDILIEVPKTSGILGYDTIITKHNASFFNGLYN
jgi:hypothetical protein